MTAGISILLVVAILDRAYGVDRIFTARSRFYMV